VRQVGRRPRLNGLRGFAILMILAFHATRRNHVLPGAYVGVEIYFVLSGFLITALLIDEFATTGRISFPRFFARRALRLAPPLLPFFAASLLILLRVHDGLRTLMERFLIATVGYCANIFLAFGHNLYWAHSWSLSAEERFYLVWPALLFLLLRSRLSPRVVTAATAAAFILASLPRVLLWRYGGYAGDSRFAFYSPFTHADGLLLGCLLGQFFAWNLIPDRPSARRMIGGAGAASLAFVLAVFVWVPTSSGFLYDGGFTLIALACALLVLGSLQGSPVAPFRLLDWRPLRYTGKISYGLYLWNVVFLFNYPGTAFNPVLATALTFAVAAASFRWIETPALRRKGHFAAVAHQTDVVIEPAAPEPHISAARAESEQL
jgi:peptidoglycan/LPS O-acetylase OafA/YrhL